MIQEANDPVDVWIDDWPESILADSTMTPEQLEQWRYADRIASGIHVEVTMPAF